MKAILQTVFLALAVMALSVPADAGPFALVELMMMREARGWRGGAVISSQPEPNRPAWLGTFFCREIGKTFLQCKMRENA